jgi:hypothetical protein
MFARKYSGGGEFVPDGRHAWLRLTAESAYISMVAKRYDRNGQLL